jgi:hypothetical protein
MFRHYRVILREFVVSTLLSYTSMSNAAVGNTLIINPLNAKLNPICHLLALLGGATIVVVSRLRVKHQRMYNLYIIY